MVTQFTPLASTFGGALIGAAAVMWMLFNGRISGISGILGSLLPPYANVSFAEAAAFILGLVGAPVLWMVLTARPIQQSVSTNVILMATAGLLVGIGTIYGYGCISGHGVCQKRDAAGWGWRDALGRKQTCNWLVLHRAADRFPGLQSSLHMA